MYQGLGKLKRIRNSTNPQMSRSQADCSVNIRTVICDLQMNKNRDNINNLKHSLLGFVLNGSDLFPKDFLFPGSGRCVKTALFSTTVMILNMGENVMIDQLRLAHGIAVVCNQGSNTNIGPHQLCQKTKDSRGRH